MVLLLYSVSMLVYILNELFNKQNTKVTDKSGMQTNRLVYAFVVRKTTKSGFFFATRPIYYDRFSSVFKAIQLQFPIITKDSQAACNT